MTDPDRKGTEEPGAVAVMPQTIPPGSWGMPDVHGFATQTAIWVSAWEQDASPGLRASRHSGPRPVLSLWS